MSWDYRYAVKEYYPGPEKETTQSCRQKGDAGRYVHRFLQTKNVEQPGEIKEI